ncbi:MAG: hypothetical protein L6Q33_01225 [Bacteriovoracaceae bacterium]|nr:hypothetical protein [Bacteriovoracaceae bacterium]
MKKITLKNSIQLVVFISILMAPLATKAMGSKKPTPKPTRPTPLPTDNSPTENLSSPLPIDTYKNIASLSGKKVDEIKGRNELTKSRVLENDDFVDSCKENEFQADNFSESISFYVQRMLETTPSKVSYIASYYGLSNNEQSYAPVSLMSHPLCSVSSSTLTQTLGKNIPSSAVILKINQFVDRMNTLRQNALLGDQASKEDLAKEWSTWFSCLGYTESLSTADSAKSQAIADKYAPTNYRKPAGVKFYEDPYQDEASKLNIGLYQFTPTSSGNIQSCLRAWNEIYPTCTVNLKGARGEMINHIGSSMQSFNAFCGVHKMIQTFSIQTNTTKSTATHPTNIVNGKFKDANIRCVTPHIAAGKGYNHFGPYQNSTGSNLSELLSCLERSRN